MNLELRTSCCDILRFFINGIEADESDFGAHWDHNEYNINDVDDDIDEDDKLACRDMRFESNPFNQYIANKYCITFDEYMETCNMLQKKLSIGYCGACV